MPLLECLCLQGKKKNMINWGQYWTQYWLICSLLESNISLGNFYFSFLLLGEVRQATTAFTGREKNPQFGESFKNLENRWKSMFNVPVPWGSNFMPLVLSIPIMRWISWWENSWTPLHASWRSITTFNTCKLTCFISLLLVSRPTTS